MTGGSALRVRSLLNIRRPMQFGDYVWSDLGVPATGTVRVRVDLPRQTVSVFRDGHEIGTAVILYGTDHKPTPTGTFPILMRARQHTVAIHASAVRRGSATHGCIGIPLAFAQLLFDQVARGDLVTIVGA
jgi:lipoprotein-anchoring transpeptidase ErfK/SrfK